MAHLKVVIGLKFDQVSRLAAEMRLAATMTSNPFNALPGSATKYLSAARIVSLDAMLRLTFSRGEPLVDTARVLDRYLDVLAIRTFEQKDLVTFANYAKIPVINALTDEEHPCQVLADLMTVKEYFGKLEGVTLTYLGDGNNMANSLMLGCAMMGMNVRIACPQDFLPNPQIVEKAQAIAKGKTEVTVTVDAKAAVKNAQVIYTDVWASMGQEKEATSRIPVFAPYQVNEELVEFADRNAIVLHCLPAHRDEEITDAVIEGSRSRVWDQAENRMHAQQALLASILESD